ncbi:FKBP-type peptidyl-prolyl isomerase-like protein [Sphingomonas sp. PP-CE-3A-406]|jgi:FKBP-type peptidyl-prolyl cis-trans isomerase FkpA|uniref:FKBP-type peptidyl-prolyl cis-trans isomerase n=1 Tax=unclassified Sphingomonas TaxID=196159 RepID=UPI000EF9A2C5|nr:MULTISPECIES: FKBP-type peptidyl-prolyl cis-trans isomerase [unclassified Sphingomonas]RMB54074.1 FKBP-type peptidyl-prolyl isomerase-like protein [Sphingomonas sp. PP-CE-3A-406]TCP71486.1 FKBP-type peptidyl-prolyl isomerase-like protein [Sphingomonas sp. PP-CE-1G-424]
MSTVTAVPLQPTKRSYLVYLWVGIALALIAAVALARQGDDPLARNARARGVVVTASGLQYKVIAPGKPGAAKPTDADVALVNYEGKLLNGTTFDKSQQPMPMPVTGVVPGFSEALKLMPKGSKYRFWMKPSLGYGDKAAGPIPANSTLVFDVELLDFLPQSVVQQMQAQAQMGRGAPGGMPGGAQMQPQGQPQGQPQP